MRHHSTKKTACRTHVADLPIKSRPQLAHLGAASRAITDLSVTDHATAFHNENRRHRRVGHEVRDLPSARPRSRRVCVHVEREAKLLALLLELVLSGTDCNNGSIDHAAAAIQILQAETAIVAREGRVKRDDNAMIIPQARKVYAVTLAIEDSPVGCRARRRGPRRHRGGPFQHRPDRKSTRLNSS